MSEKITRRRFLQAGAAVLAAAALTACGGGGGSAVVVNPTPEKTGKQLGDIEIQIAGLGEGHSGSNVEMTWRTSPYFKITNLGNTDVVLKADEFAAKVNGAPASYVGGNLLNENGEQKIEAGKSVTGSLTYESKNQEIKFLEITITHAKKKIVYTYNEENRFGTLSPVTDA